MPIREPVLHPAVPPGGAPGRSTSSERISRLLLRIAALLAAAFVVTAGLLHPAIRNAEGALTGRVALIAAAAAVALVLGFTARTPWAAAGRWFSLAILGQASALQLIAAGNLVGHQHYRAPADLLSPSAGVVMTQAFIVLIAARRRISAWVRAAIRALGPARTLAVAALFMATSAALSASVGSYATELWFATFVQLVNLLTIVTAVLAIPQRSLESARATFDRVLGEAAGAAQPGRPDGFAWSLALLVLVVCSLLARFVYQAHPHVPDEVVYLLHARYFAEGMLSMPLPPVGDAFNLDLMTYEADRWYSPVPPGWPAALSVGAYFGAPWLVNPVLNALNVLLAYAFLRELYERRTARIALILLCVSPWFLFMGMNFMTHTLTLSAALVAALAAARLRRGGAIGWALPGGLAIGLLGLIRPLEGLTVAALATIWLMTAAGSGWVLRAARVGALGIVALAAGAITLPYNAHLAGDPLTFPLMAYTDSIYGPGVNALGFGANRGIAWPGLDPFPGHGVRDVIVNTLLNTHSVNVELLGWSIGSLLPVLLAMAGIRLRGADRWMVVVVAAIVGVHTAYWFSGGPDFGARYWYLIIVPLLALAARAPAVVAELLARGGAHDRERTRTRFLVGATVLTAASVICFLPWRAADKYYNYRLMRADVRELARTHEFGRSLVLVRGRRHPDYASAAVYNPIDFQADAPVYVWDREPSITRDALEAYRDRPVWIVDGPSVTGAGFRVSEGPIPAPDLLRETAAP